MHPILSTVVPVFSIIAVGVLLGGRPGLDRKALATVAVDVAGPCFVFTLLSTSSMSLREGAVLIGGAAWMAAATTALCLLVIRGRASEHRGLLLVAAYWNAGNLALSCSRLAFGDEGARRAALVFCTTMTLHATFGVSTALGRGRLGGVLRAPLFHSAWLGLLVSGLDLRLPGLLTEPIRMLGEITIPLLLLTLGIQLRQLRVVDLKGASVAVAIRMVGGPIAMLLFVSLLDVTGVSRQVLLLNSVMPAAVINVAIAERYDVDPELVVSATVLGTLLALIVIPVTLGLLVG